VGDKQEYKDQEERRIWEKRDPIAKLSRWLIETEGATPDALAAIEAAVTAEIATTADKVKQMPEPQAGDLMAHIHAGTN
jgi:pyruvate dehydrogenase E1 component alpha subunit